MSSEGLPNSSDQANTLREMQHHTHQFQQEVQQLRAQAEDARLKTLQSIRKGIDEALKNGLHQTLFPNNPLNLLNMDTQESKIPTPEQDQHQDASPQTLNDHSASKTPPGDSVSVAPNSDPAAQAMQQADAAVKQAMQASTESVQQAMSSANDDVKSAMNQAQDAVKQAIGGQQNTPDSQQE